MVQKNLIGIFFILTLTFALFGCNNVSEPKENQEHKEKVVADSTTKDVKNLATVYHCPMKCEGEKTYAEAGKCPECEMDLEILE